MQLPSTGGAVIVVFSTLTTSPAVGCSVVKLALFYIGNQVFLVYSPKSSYAKSGNFPFSKQYQKKPLANMKDFLYLFEIQNIWVLIKHQISLPSVIFIYEVVVLLRSLEFISVHSTNPVRLIPHKIFVIQYLFLARTKTVKYGLSL